MFESERGKLRVCRAQTILLPIASLLSTGEVADGRDATRTPARTLKSPIAPFRILTVSKIDGFQVWENVPPYL